MANLQPNKLQNNKTASALATLSDGSGPNPAFPWLNSAALKQQSFGALNGGPGTGFQSQWHQQSVPAGSSTGYAAFPPWQFGGGGQGQTQNQALNSALSFMEDRPSAGRSKFNSLDHLLQRSANPSVNLPLHLSVKQFHFKASRFHSQLVSVYKWPVSVSVTRPLQTALQGACPLSKRDQTSTICIAGGVSTQ